MVDAQDIVVLKRRNRRCAKVLLVHPRPSAGNCTVPYSCLAVAAPLVAEGHEVRIVDEVGTEGFDMEVRRAAKDADVIGISCFTGFQIDSALRVARVFREDSIKAPLVWGGYHPSLYPEVTIKSDLVDFVITGQGEWTFLDFVERIMRDDDPAYTPGLWRIVDGEPIQNSGKAPFRNLEEFPAYPFHLVALEKFLTDTLSDRSVSYHSSLGCPFKCNFCAVTQIYDARWSGFTAKRVVSDVNYIVKRTGARSVEFYDNNFFVNDGRTSNIARGLIDSGFELPWSAEARPEKIASYDDEMMRLLKRSGLAWLFIGAESGHNRVLEMMQRDNTVEDIVAAAEQLARYGLDVTFSFNLGYPGEPSDNFAKTDALVKDLMRINPKTEIMIYITTAYESTPSFHNVSSANAKQTTSLDSWQHLDQRNGARKLWLASGYADRLWNYQMETFYATSFHQARLRARHPRNPFLKALQFAAKAHVNMGYHSTIVDLKVLNRLFRSTSKFSSGELTEMWTGRS